MQTNTKMRQIVISLQSEDGYCESSVKMYNAIITDLTLINSELDLIKMQILGEINKLRNKKIHL